MTCTTEGCETPTEAYLCHPCVSDLAQWLEQGTELLPEMDVTIARLDAVRPASNEGNNGTKSAGSAPPLNLDALEVKMDLEIDLQYPAHHYAGDPWSASEVPRVIANINKADLMVHGPKDDAPTEIAIEQLRKKLDGHFPEPMPPTECEAWLRENAGIKIGSGTVNKWFHRGKILKHDGSTPKRPLYSPKEVLAVHIARQHEGS